jgi:hypothetical protein
MQGGAPDSEVQYIGEFQTEYINSEIFGLFEKDNRVLREDLYICAKAMGGWSQQDGKLLFMSNTNV